MFSLANLVKSVQHKKERVHSPEKKKLKVELFKFPSAYFIDGITSTKD
jgi:hypothetical protein